MLDLRLLCGKIIIAVKKSFCMFKRISFNKRIFAIFSLIAFLLLMGMINYHTDDIGNRSCIACELTINNQYSAIQHYDYNVYQVLDNIALVLNIESNQKSQYSSPCGPRAPPDHI
jgi:hypothetical protein